MIYTEKKRGNEKRMKMPIRFKTLAKVVVAIAIIVALTSFSLVKTHDRGLTHRLPKQMVEQVNRQTRGMTEMQIMDYSLDLTAKSLKFAEKNDIEHGKANCVGYAQLCSAICNQALKNNGYSHRAKPVVGYIADCGINLCALFKSVAPTRHWQNCAYQVKTTTSPTDGKTTIVLSDGAVNPYWGVGKEATREEINKKRDEVLAKTFRKGFEWQPVSQVSPNGEPFIRMRLNDTRTSLSPTKNLFTDNNEPIYDTSINTNVRPMNGEDSYGTSIVGRGVYPNGVPYSSHYDEWDLGFTGIPGIIR